MGIVKYFNEMTETVRCRNCFFFFEFSLEDIFSLLLEIKEGREREALMWERNMDWLPPVSTLTEDQTCKPGMCPDLASNLQTCTLSVYGTMLQPTEPHWPGQDVEIFTNQIFIYIMLWYRLPNLWHDLKDRVMKGKVNQASINTHQFYKITA